MGRSGPRLAARRRTGCGRCLGPRPGPCCRPPPLSATPLPTGSTASRWSRHTSRGSSGPPPRVAFFADTWAQIQAAWDGNEHVDIAWIPAHSCEADVGEAELSNGARLTHIDRDANAEADRLAKAAAAAARVGRALTGPLAAQSGVLTRTRQRCTARPDTETLTAFAATRATESRYDRCRGDLSRAVMHGHTYTGNPLGAAVALETLNVFDDERVLEQMPPRCEAVSALEPLLAAGNSLSS